MGRCFHLTKYGNEIVAMNTISAMISQQSKMMNQPASPIIIDPGSCPVSDTIESPPPPPSAPYVATGGKGPVLGKCHVHVSEIHNCMGDAHNLDTEVTIWDVGGNQIGHQSSTEAGATDPLSVKSRLEALLVVVPEHQHDYIQFTLGTENFDSTQQDQTALSWCSTGGWDPKEGPACGRASITSVSGGFFSGRLAFWLILCVDSETANGLLFSVPIPWGQIIRQVLGVSLLSGFNALW